MKSEDIRKLDIPEYDSSKPNMLITVAGLKVFREFTAQLAEANEHLAKIANPLMVTEESKLKWVGLVVEGNPTKVNVDEVAAVVATNIPDVNCSVILRSGCSMFAKGTVTEVCKKLGIPVEGQ